MKKIVSLMIGLSLIMGTASIVFAQDKDDTKKEEGKKKGKKKGAVEITYDEDLGMFITRKKRKPGRAKDEVFGLLEDE